MIIFKLLKYEFGRQTFLDIISDIKIIIFYEQVRWESLSLCPFEDKNIVPLKESLKKFIVK